MFNFEERPLAEILGERIGIPVSIDNDTRAMAYGELLKGAVKGEKDIVFINISWGLGSAFIIDGKIYTGRSGFSGEFGHFSVFDNEIICRCGKKAVWKQKFQAQPYIGFLCRKSKEWTKFYSFKKDSYRRNVSHIRRNCRCDQQGRYFVY